MDAFREPLLSFAKRHKVSSVSGGGDVASSSANLQQLGSSSESLATLSARLRKISGTVSDADSSQGRYSVGFAMLVCEVCNLNRSTLLNTLSEVKPFTIKYESDLN